MSKSRDDIHYILNETAPQHAFQVKRADMLKKCTGRELRIQISHKESAFFEKKYFL